MSGSQHDVYEVFDAPRTAVSSHEEPCAVCAGSGHAAGGGVRICPTCVGRGTLRVSGAGGGRWLQVEPCGSCGGEGRVPLPCTACEGCGTASRERRIRIAPRLENRGSEPGESRLIRAAVAVVLVLALAFLVFLLQTG